MSMPTLVKMRMRPDCAFVIVAVTRHAHVS